MATYRITKPYDVVVEVVAADEDAALELSGPIYERCWATLDNVHFPDKEATLFGPYDDLEIEMIEETRPLTPEEREEARRIIERLRALPNESVSEAALDLGNRMGLWGESHIGG